MHYHCIFVKLASSMCLHVITLKKKVAQKDQAKQTAREHNAFKF